ncbi:MAG: C25 family cysteine peptidase, partial [Candidatus Taylorbacteria bacterium]|nr:C25 family cysteine peptidase [Candidatus Taylorbacteria bacterium]
MMPVLSNNLNNTDINRSANLEVGGKIFNVLSLEPIIGADITFSGPNSISVQSDLSGNYRVDGLIPGKYDILISNKEYLSQSISILLDHSQDLSFCLGKRIDSSLTAFNKSNDNKDALSSDQINWVPFSSGKPSAPKITAETTLGNSTCSILIDFDLGGVERIDTENGTTFKIVDGVFSLEPGAPVVPAIESKFALPQNAKISKCEIIEYNTTAISNITPIIHVPYAKTPHGLVPLRYELKRFTGLYPDEFYRINNVSDLKDGNSLSSITFWPVQFDPINKSVFIASSAKILIDFTYMDQLSNSTTPFVSSSMSEFGKIGVLPRGTRYEIKANRIDADDATEPSERMAYLVEEDGRSEYSMISLSFWRTNSSENSKNYYGILAINKSELAESNSSIREDPAIVSAKALYHLSEYGVVNEITNYSQVMDLIEKEWASSPGIVLFGQDKTIASNLCPLSSYINWPLVGILKDSDLIYLRALMNSTKSKYIIKGGTLSIAVEDWLNTEAERNNITLITLNSSENINKFFYVQKAESGFFNTIEDPLAKIYDGMVINKDFKTKNTLISQSNELNSDYYLVVATALGGYRIAATQLATYRSASMFWYDGWNPNANADQIRNYINSQYNPSYIALLGDGNNGRVPFFYIPNPTGHNADEPDDMPTDFYYEARKGTTVGSLPSSWVPDSYVGRVIGSNDLETQEYINTVKNYESGGFTETNWVNWAILGSNDWGFWDDENTMRDIKNYLLSNGGLQYPQDLYSKTSSHYNQHPFSEYEYVQGIFGLDNTIPGVTVGYVNTHGNRGSIWFSCDSNGVCKTDPNDSNPGGSSLTANEVGFLHETLWRRHPFLQYTDSCLSTYIAGDPSTNIGCRFIDSEAIGFIGADMESQIGKIDGLDRAFFEHWITDNNAPQGGALAWAKETWYSSQWFPGDWDRKTVLEMMLIGDPYVNIRISSNEKPNTSPNVPSIPYGTIVGLRGVSYSYSTSATDPDGDQVKYTFDWGDTTTSVTGLVNSGTSASMSHNWNNAGTYQVKAMATDSKGATSGWSSGLAVSIVASNVPDKIGVLRNGNWYLDYNGNRAWDSGDVLCYFGITGDRPAVGDWTGDDKDEIGILRNGNWYLDYNGNRAWDSGDVLCYFGISGDLPAVGDWNGDGKDEIGILRNGNWY